MYNSPMHNIMVMSIKDCSQELLHNIRSFSFGKISLLNNFVKKFSSSTEFNDNVVVLLILVKLIKFKDVRMIQLSEHLNLTDKLPLIFIRRDFLFLNDLHSSDRLALSVGDLSDLGKSSSSLNIFQIYSHNQEFT